MKAAVLYQKDGLPVYADFPDPGAQNNNELVIRVTAAALKHLDKSKASGQHYSTRNDISQAKVIGGDGVGILEDGTPVYGIGVSGMIAEKAVIEKDRMVKLPDGIDHAIAAALPNAVMGSAMALRFRAGLQPGETVLINGATGFTGKIAVQVAKLYGAKKIIVTGRNENSLQSLLALGAHETISVNQDDEAFVTRIKDIHHQTPIDVVIDYLWGHTAELILSSFKGKGSFTHKTRFVSIGAVTGDSIQLSAANLRSVNLHLSGSGLGSWTKKEVQILFSEILPAMFQLAAEGKLTVDVISVGLKDIQTLWDRDMPDGRRLVVRV